MSEQEQSKSFIVNLAAIAFILLFAGVIAALFLTDVPTGNDGTLKEMLVTLRDSIIFIVGFLFGSSMGGRIKDAFKGESEKVVADKTISVEEKK
jgi:uncharacterized membrane protein